MQLVNMYTNMIDDTGDRIAIPGLLKNLNLYITFVSTKLKTKNKKKNRKKEQTDIVVCLRRRLEKSRKPHRERPFGKYMESNATRKDLC